MRDPVLTARVPVDLAAWVSEYAADRGATTSQVVRAALEGLREDSLAGVPDLPGPD